MIWRIGLLNVADCDAVPASACAPQLTATLFPGSKFPHHTVSLVVLTACLLLCFSLVLLHEAHKALQELHGFWP